MSKKALISLSLFVMAMSSTSFASGITGKDTWQVTVYKEADGKTRQLYKDLLPVTDEQEDGSLVYSNKHFILVEPPAGNKIMTLAANDIKVDNSSFSGIYSFNTGKDEYTSQTKREKVYINAKKVVPKDNTK